MFHVHSALKCDSSISTLSQTIAMAIPSAIVEVLSDHPMKLGERLFSAHHCMAFLGADAPPGMIPNWHVIFQQYDVCMYVEALFNDGKNPVTK